MACAITWAAVWRRTCSSCLLYTSVLDFGPDAAAFDAGQQVLLCFPTRQVPDQMLSAYHTPEILLAPGEDISNRDYPLPDAEVQLHFYSGQGEALALSLIHI